MRSRAHLQGRQAGEGWGQEADRGRAQAGRSPRSADPKRPGLQGAPHAARWTSERGSRSRRPPRAASLASLLRLLSDRLQVCPLPRALFLTATTRMTAWFSQRLHHLSTTEVLMVANQGPAGPAGPADSSPWLSSPTCPK